MGFPILNLPLVPFRDILRMLEFKDLISISLCSQQCHTQTKRNLYKLKDWEICAVIDRNPGIIFRKGETEKRVLGVSLFGYLLDEQCDRVQSCQKNPFFPVVTNGYGYVWPRIQIGMYGAWKHVTELFQKDVEMIRYQNCTTWMMLLPMMFGQTTVPITHFRSEGKVSLRRVALAKVLEECSSEHLQIGACFSECFRFVRFGNYRTFKTLTGLWITVCHLTRMKCSKISIGYSKWNNSDANKFLRHWIYKRGMPNLEWLDIAISFSSEFREEMILDGLGEFITRTGNKRRFEKYGEDFTFNGLEIRSKSGSVASIHVDTNSNTLRMAVWQ